MQPTKLRLQYWRIFKSLCPNEWVDRWDDQRDRGVFPYVSIGEIQLRGASSVAKFINAYSPSES